MARAEDCWPDRVLRKQIPPPTWSIVLKKVLVLGVLLIYFGNVSATGFGIEAVSFISHDVELSGSLVFPEQTELRSAVVFVHGSGKQARNLALAQRFAAEGVAALVYDKRGAGRSGGEYESQQSVSEKNIQLLADDAVAAFQLLEQHPRTKDLKLGFAGISQAGWIVPIAAARSPGVAFMVLWSAPVCKVSEEDIFSKYTADLDGAKIPSYREALAARTRPYRWPDFLGKDSDPVDSLSEMEIPALWLFGKQDGSVPVDLSIERLNHLIQTDKPYEYVLFSSLGHNNMPETFSTATSWINRLPE